MNLEEEISLMNDFGENPDFDGGEDETGQQPKGVQPGRQQKPDVSEGSEGDDSLSHGFDNEESGEHNRKDESEPGSQGGDSGSGDVQPPDSGDGDGTSVRPTGDEQKGATPDPKSDQGELLRQIEELRNSNAEMKAALEKLMEKPGEEKKVEEPAFQLEDEDFLADFEVEDVSEIPKKEFGSVINKVYKTAVQKGFELAMKQVPEVVRSTVRQHVILTEAVNKFYSENADLLEHKAQVSNIAEELLSKNPDWTVEKLFSTAAEEARKRLNLGGKKKKAEAKPAIIDKPSGGLPKTKPRVSQLLAEIDEMNNAEL